MAGKERHGGLLHPAFNYISVWELSNLANGSSIADYVYTCIGGPGWHRSWSGRMTLIWIYKRPSFDARKCSQETTHLEREFETEP